MTMRVYAPKITAKCATCGGSFHRSWFRMNQTSRFCSGECRKRMCEIEAIGARIDRLMDSYVGSGPECVRDIYLTMADSECARMKILTGWDSV